MSLFTTTNFNFKCFKNSSVEKLIYSGQVFSFSTNRDKITKEQFKFQYFNWEKCGCEQISLTNLLHDKVWWIQQHHCWINQQNIAQNLKF
jgi:hypothetical protein